MKNYWSSKLSKVIAVICITAHPYIVSAQFSKQDSKIEKGQAEEKYLYPINPGQPGSLAGTMGELRSTHFHSGIDIRTNNMIGFPVRASKSGYISRASMGGNGYGNVLYITHPDGNTTLYAHLDQFKGPVAERVLQEQYKLKSGEIDLFFEKDVFRVKQGDTIALSGNSGGSTGPHLHFDIRDSNNYALDPLKVGGFKEIADNIPPASEKIALVTLDTDSRINDRFGRYEFYSKQAGSNYVIANPILVNGTIGIEILAKDKLAYKSPFYGGVNFFEVWVDSALVFRQSIDKLNVAETRSIYTLMDFKTMRSKGTRFYKLYIDDGNELKFYGGSPTSGKIKISPAKTSTVQIRMKDSYNNTSTVSFRLRSNPVIREVSSLEPMTTDAVLYDITDNTMMITAKAGKDLGARARVYTKGVLEEMDPTYSNINRKVYLFDLRKNIPDSVQINNKTIRPRIKIAIPSGTEYKYYSDIMDIQFPVNAIYDTLYLNTDYTVDKTTGNEVFTIGTRTVPLNKSISVSIKTTGTYSADAKYHVYRSTGRSYAFVGGEWQNGRFQFNTREFGEFTILRDIEPPSIRPVYVNNQTVRFKIRDNLSGISSFEAAVDGQWLLMHYDSKTATIWSERLDKTTPLKGNLELTVTDNAGNKSTFTQKIL
ncbi:MAG TPA: M23 family metallopeptidase [Ohtaekwangia sp.]|uniref:M23 family metallopeptidase n=1 Tax=Ohtaekwangia sp. TaxID=2066019 RepID=UPI002F922777